MRPALLRKALIGLVAAFFLYIFAMDRVGLLGPDEPRYAAIGREMAWSGDWVTPRLWGSPWFEKPALLYWMTAVGFRLGLGDDVAPRAGVALVSIAFLAYFWRRMSIEFGELAGWYAAGILGTSAGWVALSQIGITDLPMSAALAAAMLTGMPLLEPGRVEWRRSAVVGALLGLAVLAKGLVPLVLALPLVIALLWRRRWVDIGVIGLAALVVAGPWYWLCYLQNGWPFIDDFFVRHHFRRFDSDLLQHEQPWWFYFPVVVGLLFPWWPLLIGAVRREVLGDQRLLFFIAWVGWGLLFFSASRNKLPAYVLPTLPALAGLMALGSAHGLGERVSRLLLTLSAVSLLLLPVVARVLPTAVLVGLGRSDWR
ncbi:MAG TPA: glycosyltransferase family 39 protein, partial [Bryobacteraceae bacterium]|nr:glycosyltransferase family 39 protein [Bryobacteraceae bacterium]